MTSSTAHEHTVCVIGLGYVGLPVAVAFGKKYKTIGFDVNTRRLEKLRTHIDENNDITKDEIASTRIEFTDDSTRIKEASFVIIAVPTPVDDAHAPDLRALVSASEFVGKNLKPGAIVVYESTVYPGVTENICLPIIERESGLKKGQFAIGYSPERVNPGDKTHTFEKINKVVSGMDERTTKEIARMYGSVISAQIFEASSIKVAEAAKIIENTQRDINIALMNELKMIFDRMDVPIADVLAAARTKWNFLAFHPGLVGGHCIGVDPYYLAYEAQRLGHHPAIILAGRRINDGMAVYEAGRIVKHLHMAGTVSKGLHLLILGASFKPDVNDLRNSKVADLATELEHFGCVIAFHDPLAPASTIFGRPNLSLDEAKKRGFTHALLAVPHAVIKSELPRIERDFSLLTLLA